MAKWYVMNKKDNKVGEIYLYGEIIDEKWFDSDVTPTDFIKDLKEMGNIETLNLFVNSPGGNIYAAQSIYSILNRHEAKVIANVDGIAASAMSFLIQAADEIKVGENAMIMTHKALIQGWLFANAEDLRVIADALDAIQETIEGVFKSRGVTDENIGKMFDGENWYTAKQAVEMGLADTLIENKKLSVEKKDESTIIVNKVAYDEKKLKYKNFPKEKLIENNKPLIFTPDEPKIENHNMEYNLYQNEIDECNIILEEAK